ncbi:MAG TPA: hypothetical protein VN328_05615, partial [Thermodesulfovibrionales bacterium]|nr:hypothetical protein [Thermodesulfovibrionales bacterium]
IYEREPGNTKPDDDTWVDWLPGSVTKGDGTATVFRGYAFDITKEYYAEVVLNFGSEVEIRGERVKLSVTNRFVNYCKRDLNLCDVTVPICFESRDWEWVKPELHHAFISINGETFGFTSHSTSFSSRCIFEGTADVDHDLGIDHTAEMEGYMHGSCQPVGCENPDNLRRHMMNDPRPYYCLLPNSGVPNSMNCQAWANMMIDSYCPSPK